MFIWNLSLDLCHVISIHLSLNLICQFTLVSSIFILMSCPHLSLKYWTWNHSSLLLKPNVKFKHIMITATSEHLGHKSIPSHYTISGKILTALWLAPECAVLRNYPKNILWTPHPLPIWCFQSICRLKPHTVIVVPFWQAHITYFISHPVRRPKSNILSLSFLISTQWG